MDDSKYELQDFRGTLVNFKDGFHRKISTWTFFAAVSFHPRHVTFSTSVHPFSLNWSFNVIRIPVQLPVKLNTLLWNYPKKEETFHHVNTKSRQIQNFIAPCFFQCAIFFLFSFPERYSTTPWFVDDIRFYASNTSNLLRRKIPRYAIPLHRLSFACNWTFSSGPARDPIGNHEKDLARPSWRIGNDCCFLPRDR